MSALLARWRRVVGTLRQETLTLYLAYRDPRMPWYARIVVSLVVGYAFSPIDFIPDFVPVLGLLDDAVILPLGIWLALRLIPPPVAADARRAAVAQLAEGRPVSWGGALLIVGLWVAGILLAGGWLASQFVVF